MKRKLSIGCFTLIILVVALVALSAISNLFLPENSVADRLSAEDKARLAETYHLRQTNGTAIWPGWAEADIPLIVYNDAYAFLVGYPGEPPAGWKRVPDGTQMGVAWEPVPEDDFYGDRYYRQPIVDPDQTPQAFTVQVGDRWAASMQTLDQMKVTLVETVGADLPGFLRPIVPYRLLFNLFFHGSDGYVALLLHESFHAYQGTVAPEHLRASEQMVRRYEEHYPWEAEEAWQEELDLLADAMEAGPEDTEALAEQFLAHRAARREELGQNFVHFEQQREWLEGLAKYVEMEVWQTAGSGSYVAAPQTATLDDFSDYGRYERRLSDETDQIRRMAGDTGDGRFYYSGMAQAYLLDRLAPGWKTQALEEGVALDEMLATALGGREVEIFFGNSELDPDGTCDAVFPITRTVPTDGEPLAAALGELFAGPTAAEQAAGYHSWFSSATASALKGVRVEDDTAYINLADIRSVIPNASTSCGSQSFVAQVEQTVMSTEPEVHQLRYAINGEPSLFYDWMQVGCPPDGDLCDPAPFADLQ